ncbi:MAG TPA: YetF domain-containing protein [Blastocatellia bacterium]|nr:YetF domain-containing protein [Blastocatellia bacterium]
MEIQELIMTAVRALGVFAIVLVIIRLSGKRTIGNFTAFDLLVALMLGEVVDEIIYGDVTFTQGVVALLVIALAQYGTSWLSYWQHGLDKILEGAPTVIVKDGKLQRDGMRHERMNEKDVMAELRLNAIDDLREVKLAAVEHDGQVSVIKQDWAEPVQKGDFDKEAAKRKEADTRGEQEPPPEAQTDSRRALA